MVSHENFNILILLHSNNIIFHYIINIIIIYHIFEAFAKCSKIVWKKIERQRHDDLDMGTRCDRMPGITEPQPQPRQAAHSSQSPPATSAAQSTPTASATAKVAHLRDMR